MRFLPIGLLLCLALTPACTKKTPATEPTQRADTGPASTTQAGAAQSPPEPREAALSAVVLALLEQEHLLRRKIDDTVSRAAFDTYLDLLDGGKMFLLKADHDALSKHADKVDDQLRSGSFELAHDGARRMAQRLPVVETFVAKLLEKPMNLTDEEWLELDPEKLQFAATDEELSDRWRRRLELEVLERVAQMETRLEAAKAGADAGSDATGEADPEDVGATPLDQIPATAEGREARAREDLAKSYSGRFARLRSPAPLDSASNFVNAVASSVDPHTTYLPPADRANFDIQMTGSLEGIGAVLRERDHYIEVVEVVPGGASWRQGSLSPGDLILSVAAEGKAPVDVLDMRIDEVVRMIRGPKGTVVRLRVQKPTGTQETIAITRDVVVVEEAFARGAVLSVKGQPDYGYIHLPSFYGGNTAGQRTAAGDVRRLLAQLKARKVRGVVIDMRSNGGGLLGDAIELTGHLIDEGPVVQVQDSRGRVQTLGDESEGIEFDGPVVVLVDRFSASASEIVAGALQDYGRAVVVGTGPTHGKGTVQTLADLDRAVGGGLELGVFKITIQQFFRVSGSSTQRRGVVPDIVLPDPAGHIEAGERELDHAIPWSQVPAAEHDRWKAAWNTPELVKRSAARVTKQPVLNKVAATTQLLSARQKDTRMPLARPAWEARRKELRAALESLTPDLKGIKDAPARITVKPLAEPAAKPPPPPAGGGKARGPDRATRWRDSLARDPWVEESLYILGDMVK